MRPKTACIALKRSKGNPQVVIAQLNWEPAGQRGVLEYWRGQHVSHGHQLHTLILYGFPSDVPHFSWIFERLLPHLRHLTVGFSGTPDDEGGEFSLGAAEVALLPVTLQLPTDMALRELSLRNATLPWSSNLFSGLRELYLNVKDCPVPVEISEDELFRILDASPQLEDLSLIQVGPRIPVGNYVWRFSRERTVRLPNLASLWLGNSPEVVGYILAHIDTPTITSLQIRSRVPPQDVPQSLKMMIPDDPAQKQLFSSPPTFEIRTEDRVLGSLFVDIGSFKMWFYLDLDDARIISDAIVTHLQPLVPPLATALKIDYGWLGLGELRWREFLISHPEMCLIECANFCGESMSESLWDALAPTETDPLPLCPKLELVSLSGNPASTHLLNCLLNRKNTGFELNTLGATNVVSELFGEFSHLVEVLGADKPEDILAREMIREVCPISWMNFACNGFFLVEGFSL